MAHLLRTITRSNSTTSSSRSITSTNKTTVSINDVENHLQNWSIPKTSSSLVYNKSIFDFKSDYIIKTVEETLPILEEYMTIELLPQKILEASILKGYKFLHLGLVQIAVKPLTRIGLNTSLLLCLRDKRHNKYSDSMLGCVKSSLCEGPVYFNCFPDFSVSLLDPTIMKTLSLDIQTSGFDMDSASSNMVLIYRLFIKVMNTVSPKRKPQK